MRRLYALFIAGIVTLFGLAMLKNTISYSYKSIKWRLGKSIIDTTAVTLAAVYMPALAVGWVVMWLTRPIARHGVQLTLMFIFGAIFGAISGVALEIVCVLAIFAVDLLTGQQGLYGWWKEKPPASFIPFLVEDEEQAG